jgi:hypothetical protein
MVFLSDQSLILHAIDGKRNQNINLFHDPVSSKFFLTFCLDNDHDNFEIISKSAQSIQGLADAPKKLLMRTTTTVAAPTLLYVPKAEAGGKGIYYLSFIQADTCRRRLAGRLRYFIRTNRMARSDRWPTIPSNPARACLFQFIFNGMYYGYDSHLNPVTGQWEMEVQFRFGIKPSTTPLDSWPFALNQSSNNGQWRRSILAISFIGLIFGKSVLMIADRSGKKQRLCEARS